MEDESIEEMTRCCYEYYEGNKHTGDWFSLGFFGCIDYLPSQTDSLNVYLSFWASMW